MRSVAGASLLASPVAGGAYAPSATTPPSRSKLAASPPPAPAADATEAYVNAVHLYRAVVDAVTDASKPEPPLPCALGTAPAASAWLADNARRPGVARLPCGLQYLVHQAAPMQAPSPKANTECECHCRATLLDGTEVDEPSPSRRGGGKSTVLTPAACTTQGSAIALQLMGVGDKWTVYLPSELAYGDSGRAAVAGGRLQQQSPSIPPGAVIVLEIELLKVLGPSKPKPHRPPDPPPDGLFTPSQTFQGQLPGFVFTTREPAGTGYYADVGSAAARPAARAARRGGTSPTSRTSTSPTAAAAGAAAHAAAASPSSPPSRMPMPLTPGLFEREPLSSTRHISSSAMNSTPPQQQMQSAAAAPTPVARRSPMHSTMIVGRAGNTDAAIAAATRAAIEAAPSSPPAALTPSPPRHKGGPAAVSTPVACLTLPPPITPSELSARSSLPPSTVGSLRGGERLSLPPIEEDEGPPASWLPWFQEPPPAHPSQHFTLADVGSMKEQLVHFEKLARKQSALLETQQASVEQAALETVHTLLCRLKLPTLKQALSDLGLPIEGLDKTELSQRIATAIKTDTAPTRPTGRARGS